jgi:hypothetical protein
VAMRPVLRIIHASSNASTVAGLPGQERRAHPRRRTRR